MARNRNLNLILSIGNDVVTAVKNISPHKYTYDGRRYHSIRTIGERKTYFILVRDLLTDEGILGCEVGKLGRVAQREVKKNRYINMTHKELSKLIKIRPPAGFIKKLVRNARDYLAR